MGESKVGFLAEAKAKRRDAFEELELIWVKAQDDKPLRLLFTTGADAPKGSIIFMPGRSEFCEKFYEDMHMFKAFGFAVGATDTRGQGLSYHELEDRHKHYVSNFDLHLEDLESVLQKLDAIGAPKPYHIAAHSAGGHITLRYLHRYPGRIAKVVLSAPMIDIIGKPFPRFMVEGLPKLAIALGAEKAHIPGHKGIKMGNWGWRSFLTHDPDRFLDEDHFLEHKDPNLAVGGATYRWLHEALKSIKALQAEGVAESINTPTLLMQAGKDRIVDNEAQTNFAKRSPGIKLVPIKKAKHEILKETDETRREAWHHICHFMELDANLL